MYQRIKASREKENGFTLIELLIVVVILGILAAVVIFASAGFKNKGASEACKTTVSSVKTAVEAFHVDNPEALYPGSWDHLTVVVPYLAPPAAAAFNAGPYFEANGITKTSAALVDTVRGKGWSFVITWKAAAALPLIGPGSPNIPEVALLGCTLT